MKFNKIEFAEKVLRTGELLETYLRNCLLASVEESKEMILWMDSLFDNIQNLLKDTALSPTLKIKLTDFITYLFLLGQPLIIRGIENKIYPLVKNYSQYDRDLKVQKRGEEYFKNHPQYMTSNENRRSQIRRMGIQYINFFLESICVWASWIPKDVEDERTLSVFQKTYQILKQGGLQFPAETDYFIYTQHNIDRKQAFIQVILEEFFTANESNVSEKYSQKSSQNFGKIPSSLQKLSVNKANAENQFNNTDQFPSKLNKNEGAKAFFIPQLSNSNSSNNRINIPSQNNHYAGNTNIYSVYQTTNPSAFRLLAQQQNPSQNIQFPQSPRYHITIPPPSTQSLSNNSQSSAQPTLLRIATNEFHCYPQISPSNNNQITLTPNVLQNKQEPLHTDIYKMQYEQKIRMTQAKYQDEVDNLKMTINQLQTQVSFLKDQNLKLIQKLKECEAKIYTPSVEYQNNPSVEILRLKHQNAELKANILGECTELFQFTNRTPPSGSINNSRFTKQGAKDARNQLNYFEPYYQHLTHEQQIRFKKTLLKSKQIIYKDQNLQIGFLTQLLDFNRLRVCLVLTSKADYDFDNIKINLFDSFGVSIVQKPAPIRLLRSFCQQKLIYQFVIGDQMFQPLGFELTYHTKMEQMIHKQLLMPLSRIKFFIAENLQIPFKMKSQKIIVLNRSVLSSLHRIHEYSPEIYKWSLNGYQGNLSCFGQAYKIRLEQTGNETIKISVEYSRANQKIINCILQQLSFIIGK